MSRFFKSEPVAIPATSPDENTVCVEISADWIPILVGLLEFAQWFDFWEGDLDDQQSAAAQASALIGLLVAAESECPMTSFYPTHIESLALTWSFVGSGGLTRAINDNQLLYSMIRPASPANGQEVFFPVILAGGIWTLYVVGVTASDAPKVDVYLGDTKLTETPWDWYSASPVYGVIKSVGFESGATGEYLIRLVTNGKHASSSNYIFRYTMAWVE